MDPKLSDWQQAFEQSTPKVNLDDIIQRVKRQQKREKMKAFFDIGGGIAVTAYCIYALLFFSESLSATLLFAVLAPLPVTTGIWAYRLRKKQFSRSVMKVSDYIDYQTHTLKTQLTYWKVSTYILLALYTGLLLIAGYQFWVGEQIELWTSQLILNGLFCGAVCIHYVRLKSQLPKKLAAIRE